MSIPLMYREDIAETISVKRTQRIRHPYDESISYFCHLSKNLWNQVHHLVYGYYKKYGRVPSYEEIDATLNKTSYYKKNGKTYPDFDNYHKLGGATAQQTLMVYHKSWISFLKGIKDYWESKKNGDNKDYTGMPREPGYKKKDGEFILIFTNKQIKFTESKDGSVWITFPKKIDNKPSKLKNLKILLGNVNDLDPYLLKRLMWSKFDQVRIIPQGIGYTIEIVYDQEVLKNASEIYQLDKNIIMSIDLGVENLITITDNIGSQPIIIKSEIWKAENQWYNKKRAELSSIYDRQKIGCKLPEMDNNTVNSTEVPKRKFKTGFIGKYIIGEYGQKIGCKFPKKIGNIINYITNKNGKKIRILTENRNNFVMDSEHKVSRFIIERALDIRAGTVVFGKNPLWKQNVEMGRRNNQNFVQIPHADIIKKTMYKGEEVGISVIDKTEEYTSKCSFLGSEEICFHTEYMGDRIYRGLFKCSKGIDISTYTGNKKKKVINTINTDVQGAYNTLRNVDPRFSVFDIMEGVVAHGLVPERLSISDLMTKSYQVLRMNYRLTVDSINCANN